jgi:N-acetylglucosamine kinase-like BadF-type ATPase
VEGKETMPYFLGVDAGGTKTDFLLGDATGTLERVRTGTIKLMRTGEAAAAANLDEALRQLTEVSGVAMSAITRCCIGAAGVTVPLVTDWLRQAFAERVGGGLILVGDVEIALDAAFHGGRGVLVLAGTGSNVAGRAATGETLTAGGWGPAMADQGSAHYLGLAGLRRGFLAVDRDEPSMLLERVRAAWGLGSIGELIERANANPAPDFSALAPLVVACAAEGDDAAREVVEQGGADLAVLVGLVTERIRRIELRAGLEFALPEVAVTGSILERVTLLRESLRDHLQARYPGLVFHSDPVDPAEGALWRARQGAAQAD